MSNLSSGGGGEEEAGSTAKRTRRVLRVNSGGAKGADAEWMKRFARRTDFHVYRFQGGYALYEDRTHATYHYMSPSELEVATPHLIKAAASLGKRVATNPWGRKFTQRDYYIIKDVDAVYAVGKLNPSFRGLGISGGTGVSAQMYWNLGGRNLYFFDQEAGMWKIPSFPEGEGVTWKVVDIPPSPFTYDVVACIGSRDLTATGKSAIHNTI
jgi:hypothetical protein